MKNIKKTINTFINKITSPHLFLKNKLDSLPKYGQWIIFISGLTILLYTIFDINLITLIYYKFWSILIFILILSLLIFVHEFGHFFTALKCGVKVEEFAIGMGKTLWSRRGKKNNVKYCLNAIPIGGYVRMLGQDDFDVNASEKSKNDPRAFNNRPVYQRMIVVSAGVIMNFLLAILLFTIGFTAGMPSFVNTIEWTTNTLVISKIMPDSPALSSDIQINDQLLKINDQTIDSLGDIIKLQKNIANKLTTYTLLRDNKEITLNIKVNEQGQAGLGITQNNIIKLPIHKAFLFSIKESYSILKISIKGISKIFINSFKGEISDSVGGPIKIATVVDKAVNNWFLALLQLTAMLSLSLGAINGFPFPALDGGRFFFMFLELIFRRKVINSKIEDYLHIMGMVLLLMFMLVITWKDLGSIGS